MNILIIEDEKILCKVLADRFKSEGWFVNCAGNGEEGLEMVRNSSFNIVLLDLLLPKKDGFQVLRELRSEEKFKNLPILIISNLGSENDIKMAMELGATDYLVKTHHSLSDIVNKAKSLVK